MLLAWDETRSTDEMALPDIHDTHPASRQLCSSLVAARVLVS